MGGTLNGRRVTDALATFLASLEIDVDAGEVTYLAVNKGHLFVGYRNGTREGWAGPDSVNSLVVIAHELVEETDDAPASQLTT